MKIAAYQGSCPKTLDKRLSKICKKAEEAVEQGIDILCFPECFLTGYYDDRNTALENSFDLTSPEFQSICRMISKGDLTIILGLNERREGKLYNTAVVIERGDLVGCYRKSYLYKNYFQEDLEFPVFEKQGVTYGVLICLDANYFEPARILAMKGARILFCPMFNRISNGHPFQTSPSLQSHFVARSFENDAYFLAADVIWRDDGIESCPGFSRIHDRDGLEVLKLGAFEEGFLVHEVCFERERPRKNRRIFGSSTVFSVLSDVYKQQSQLLNIGNPVSTSKSLIENYSNQVWNSKNIDIVDQLFSDESAIHSPLETLHGKSAMKGIIEVWLNAFPDLIVEHEVFIEEGDTVVSRWKARGTHKGSFKGIEATGLPVAYEGVSIYRLSNEKVVDYWAFVNLHHITEQLTAEAPAMKG